MSDRNTGADDRAIRVERLAQTLSTVAVDVSALVRDAYAQGYADGLACARSERGSALVDACDADDVAQRRPQSV